MQITIATLHNKTTVHEDVDNGTFCIMCASARGLLGIISSGHPTRESAREWLDNERRKHPIH